MLENCVDLQMCEIRLEEAVKSVRLLGEIPLSDQDIDLLARMVSDIVAPDISKGTRYLKTEAPTCLACFLVGMGRFYDKVSGFWPIVEKGIGPVEINWQRKWGNIFLQFLEQKGLPKFDEEDGLAYVTPILGHTCIPDSCLDEYFDRVLVPLVEWDLLNPLDQEEITHDLRVRRKINHNRLELEQNIKKQDNEIKVLKNDYEVLINRLELCKDVAQLLAQEDECEKRKWALQGLEVGASARTNLLARINEVSQRIQKLEIDGRRLWEETTVFKKRYQPIIENQNQIDDVIKMYSLFKEKDIEAQANEKSLIPRIIVQWKHLSNDPWDEKLGLEISQLSLEQLLGLVENYQNLKRQRGDNQEKIKDVSTSQRDAIRPPTSITSLLMFIRISLKRIFRKKIIQEPNELQQLQAMADETEAEMQQDQARIKELLAPLPIEERLLENPNSDLCDDLSSLQSLYIKYLEDHKKYIKLQGEKDQLLGQIREFLSPLRIDDGWPINTWVDNIREILKEARQSQATALEADRILEKEIRPILEAARVEHQHLQADLEKLDHELAEIGSGSIQQDLNLVQELHRSQAEVIQIRRDLSSKHSDFILLESELRRKGFDAINIGLEKMSKEIEDKIQAIKIEYKNSERRIDTYPAQYFGIDEPIRRFLLYGDAASEIVLTDSVLLFAQAKSGKRVKEISELKLPDRYVQRFQQWWENYQTKQELGSASEEKVNPATGERFRAPQIFLDTATGEVIATVPAQRLLRPEHGTTVQLDVFGDDLADPIFTTQLRLYDRTRGLVETHLYENIVITEPSAKFIFRLKSKDNPIIEWEIQGISEETPFYAFSPDTHKLIKVEHLPKSSLIILINNKLKIYPQECIHTEPSFLFGSWKEYVWYEVDLTTIEDLHLVNDSGRSILISLTSDLGSGIALIGGQQLPGVLSDERPVYNSSPEFIRVPINDLGDLHLLRISVLSEDENRIRKSKHYQLDELRNIIDINNEGWLGIPLTVEQLIGTNPIGCFILRVYKPPYLDWQISFCIVAQLKATFNQEIYPPLRNKLQALEALLTLPDMSTFKPDSPAELVSEDGLSWLVKTPATENKINGMLSCSSTGGDRIMMPLTIIVPKIRWRLQGLGDPHFDQWFDKVEEELWIGDWLEAQELFLLAELPHFYMGKVSLALPGNSVSVENGKIQDHKVRFDLKALEDKLRTGPPLETVAISLASTQINIPNIPLLTVRTRWQAEKIKCFYYPEGDNIRVDVSWEEKGKAGRKVARLWHLSGDRPRLIKELLVPQDEKVVNFKSTTLEIKSGKYLVHIEPDSPWASRDACPKLNDLNTAIIEIVTEAPEKAVIIRSLLVDPTHSYFLPQDSYRIHIIGKVINQKLPDGIDVEDIDHVLISPLNENWYVGNLEVRDIPEVINHLSDTNPVKFEYDTQKHIITSIEDRHGDGAVYCYDCRMLFWYQETALDEKKKNHHNYGPIEEFRVDWVSGP